ncbi:MAG: haloalkane dehalogenase [Cyanobacteria bacterium P01_E01_bin.6]
MFNNLRAITLGLLAATALTACSDSTSTAIKSDNQIASTAEQGQISVMSKEISAEFPFEKKFVDVNDSNMAYVDEGEGPVVLFLHGNPTSSYLWRNIIPYVSDNHRAIAVDLIGMGDSDKPDIPYTFTDHAAYLDDFIAALDLTDITLVVHDWGSALGMRYARLNEDNVRALAFMEAITPPGFPAPSYDAMGPEFGELFRNLRTEGVGEEMVLQNNLFIETLLPQLVVRELTEAEMDAYRAPYPTPESRLPMLQWPREVPIGGEPPEATEAVLVNGNWLTFTPMPKLLLHGEPGAIASQPVIEYLQANVSNMETVSVGPGLHFIQEDQPHAIGTALSEWLDELAQ